MNKPTWLQWAYVEETTATNGRRVRVVIRKWHPGYWLAMLIGYVRKYTIG